MAGSAQKIEKKYSYQDYCGFPDEIRCEIIDGKVYDMTPAPVIRHQSLAGKWFVALESRLKGKSCTPFISPIDVVLSDFDIVQPDVIVVCDKGKITEKNIQGAPDLVIEILSPGTALKDKKIKKALYEKYGIKEYLIVDPAGNYLERFVLDGDNFGFSEVLGPDEKLTLESLGGVEIELAQVFDVGE